MQKLDDHPLTNEETTAIRQVAAAVREKFPDHKLERKAVVACTLIYKCRVDRAVEAYTDWKEIREEFGVETIFDNDAETVEEGSDVEKYWDKYRVAGRDKEGRQIFWLAGGAIEIKDEKMTMKASSSFFLGMYGDLHSLRNGITMVIDQSKNYKKTGNERKMQRAWQKFPNRPQAIFIFGASYVKRLFLNSAIKFASLFSKQKILDRIRFAELDQVKLAVSTESMAVEYGGTNTTNIAEWVRERLSSFPVPDEF